MFIHAKREKGVKKIRKFPVARRYSWKWWLWLHKLQSSDGDDVVVTGDGDRHHQRKKSSRICRCSIRHLVFQLLLLFLSGEICWFGESFSLLIFPLVVTYLLLVESSCFLSLFSLFLGRIERKRGKKTIERSRRTKNIVMPGELCCSDVKEAV